jgi:hypothetical protein
LRRGWSNGRLAELVGVAQPIVRCGECGGVGRGRLVFQRGVRAFPIVVDDPYRDLRPRIVEVEEYPSGEDRLPCGNFACDGLLIDLQANGQT